MRSRHTAQGTGNLSAPGRATAAFAGRHARKHRPSRVRRQTRDGLKASVEAAFRTIANGCGPATAFSRSKGFCRSGGAAWARHLG